MEVVKGTENFLGLPNELASFENAKALVWPIPYEATTTYARGTVEGPAAILAASQQVEFWDDELDGEPFERGICTLPFFDSPGLNHENAMAKIEGIAAKIYPEDQFVLSLVDELIITSDLGSMVADR